jgi:hypothetical protein
LDLDSLTWLNQLGQTFQVNISPSSDPQDDLLIVHANPKDLSRIIFPPPQQQMTLYGHVRQTDHELEPLLEDTKAKTIAFGHLHIPSIRRWRDRTLVNISSLNLPGDGDARAKYAVLTWRENEGWSVEHHHVGYPVNDEILAFRHNRPPSWKAMADHLETDGLIPQKV